MTGRHRLPRRPTTRRERAWMAVTGVGLLAYAGWGVVPLTTSAPLHTGRPCPEDGASRTAIPTPTHRAHD